MTLPHPFPYQGSKRNIANKILSFFPEQVERLIEPFAGSAAVSISAAFHQKSHQFLLNDINGPLMELWRMIILEPQNLASQYRRLWNRQKDNPREYYDFIRCEFNKTNRPDYLLYLLARCVKGSIRYNSDGEFNQSPDNRRKGMHPDKMSYNIFHVSELFSGKIQLLSKDYKEVLKMATPLDVVYMDPPYQGVCGNRDSRYINNLPFEEYMNSLENLNKREINFIVSYDGRTGNKKYGKPVPERLNLTHIEIRAGRSTQATLLGKKYDTYESLYLSPALKNRLECINPQEIILQEKQLSFL